MEYELLIEEERVKQVVREYEELHPPEFESCVLCLEDIPINSSPDVCSFMACCGNWNCKLCCDKFVQSGKMKSCPLCRAELPDSQEQYNVILQKCVERGQKWAQYQMAYKCEMGQVGGRVDIKKAFKLYTLSAEQCHPPALLVLAMWYANGQGVKQSETKAREYMLQAADLGNFHAMSYLAQMYHAGSGGSVDYSLAAKYATLACHYQKKFGLPNSEEGKKCVDMGHAILGKLFLREGDGVSSSVNLAVHHLRAALKSNTKTFDCVAAYHFSYALRGRDDDLYGFHIGGFDILPCALYWARRSLAAGVDDAKKIINDLTSFESGKCRACDAPEEGTGKKFLRCSRCHIYYYCSKKCQTEHWNGECGHKLDCKSDKHFAKLHS